MNDKLVSILTPCYNGERFVHRLLESVLEQSYSRIEHIFIDDGSTDRTAEIIKGYVFKYQEKGKELVYVFQENAGQAAAINNGLKLCKGDYLTWPDSDDFYSSKDSITILVKSFEALSDDYGIVRCDAMLIDEASLKPVSKFSSGNRNPFKEDLFNDCILERGFWFAPGCYMTSMKILEEVIEDRSIFVNAAGQNWQMYLPILYKYKCKYVNATLLNYLIRQDSHSHNHGYESVLTRTFAHEEILTETIHRIVMNKNDLSKYSSIIEIKYLFQRLNIYFANYQLKEFDFYFLRLRSKFPNEITLKLKFRRFILRTHFTIWLMKMVRIFIKFIK